jgi:hypothetical protein
MTIWEQHAQVFETTVVSHAVAVIDLDGKGTSPPFRNPAFVASVFEQASPQ